MTAVTTLHQQKPAASSSDPLIKQFSTSKLGQTLTPHDSFRYNQQEKVLSRGHNTPAMFQDSTLHNAYLLYTTVFYYKATVFSGTGCSTQRTSLLFTV